jgi:hypothetical protein
MRLVLALLVVLVVSAACSGKPKDITGRVMSIDKGKLCITRDRGATLTCTDVPDPRNIQGVDVGECVVMSPDLRKPGSRVKVLSDDDCLAIDAAP